jgi:putative ABC transport system permease protein
LQNHWSSKRFQPALSARKKIPPILITQASDYLPEIVIKLKPGNIPNTIKLIREKSKEFNDGQPMSFDFFDERLKALYIDEQNFQKVIGYATGIAVFIACLGIFGISLFVCQQRIKEIGIRKVLGASVRNIFYLLTKEYVVMIVLSSLIAFPVSLYLIGKWLQNFEYKVDIDLWSFVISDIIAISIIIMTVSIKAIKTVRENPVEALKYE